MIESDEVVDYPRDLFINRNRDFVQLQRVIESPPRSLQRIGEESILSTRDSARMHEEMRGFSNERQFMKQLPREIDESSQGINYENYAKPM